MPKLSLELTKVIDETQLANLKDRDVFKAVINQNPPKQWIKNHPIAKGVKYLPIDKVELTLDTLFEEWRVEIKSIAQLAQSIVCTVRLHYKDPITSEWSFQDGVGATPLKTNKGSSAADLSNIKNDAVATGAPSAKAFAIKDAADHIGNLFGRNINRKDAIGFSAMYDKSEQEEADNKITELDKAIKLLKSSKTLEELKTNFLSLGLIRKEPAIVKLKDQLKTKLEKK